MPFRTALGRDAHCAYLSTRPRGGHETFRPRPVYLRAGAGSLVFPPSRPRMKLKSLAAALALTLASAATAPAQLRIDVNPPANRLQVFDGDSVIRTYRVSVGMPGHDTPD